MCALKIQHQITQGKTNRTANRNRKTNHSYG